MKWQENMEAEVIIALSRSSKSDTSLTVFITVANVEQEQGMNKQLASIYIASEIST